MKQQLLFILGLVAVLCVWSGCAKPRPVLYPNDHLHEVGRPVADRDIQDCLELAKAENLEGSRAGKTAGSATVGAGVGAAVGAAVGAIGGNPGRAAAIGAAGGGVGGFFRGLFGSREPDPLYRSYVEICLQERGYRLIGWK